MMLLKPAAFFYSLLLAHLASAQPDTLNPLKGDIRVHDPVMIKEGTAYYVFHTGFGVGVKTSTDRIHWKKTAACFRETTCRHGSGKTFRSRRATSGRPTFITATAGITCIIPYRPG